ncbi:DUF6538 domain-containing protein, partial [Pontiella sp.]|uniref:DUF6538 domain-containing protein n=1 Tax=Pontiella sp. TaxID=2837462 RepID=UPI003564EBAF
MAKIISMKLKNVETRNDWYHFRLNVPKDLQDRIGKKVIKKSLETQDDLVAQRLADRLSQEWKAEFKAMRSDNPERNKSIDERIDTMRRAMRPPLDNFVENCCKHPDPEIERTLEDLEIEHDWIVEKQWWQVSVMGLYEDLRTATNKQEDPRMVRRVIRLYREMLNHCYAGLKEELGVAIDIPFRAPTWKAEGQDRAESQSSGYSKSKSTLSDCLKEILDDGKQREGRTILSLKSDVALFEEFHGVKPVGQYTLQDIISFRDDCLRKVTVNGHKLFPNLSLKQLIELPEGTLSANGKEAKKPSINTVKNRLRSIRQVFLHAKDTGKITVNPCATVKDIQQEANKVGKQSSKQEKAFTPEQIKEIMRASKAENGKTHPARRWATQL